MFMCMTFYLQERLQCNGNIGSALLAISFHPFLLPCSLMDKDINIFLLSMKTFTFNVKKLCQEKSFFFKWQQDVNGLLPSGLKIQKSLMKYSNSFESSFRRRTTRTRTSTWKKTIIIYHNFAATLLQKMRNEGTQKI